MSRLLQNQRLRRRIEFVTLGLLILLAVYRFSAPYRAESALRSASLTDLIARSKRERDDPRIFYHLGIRMRALGQAAPARAAFARREGLPS